MRNNLLFLILFALLFDFSYGQGPQLVKVIQPAPNVQAMQKYGDIPVSPYTGIPDISIPIYTAKFRDVSVPISVSYHASGIKVAEEASQVGLGWTLNAGGVISRNIIGEDDWAVSNYTYFNNGLPDLSDGKAPANYFFEGCDLPCIDSRNSPTSWTLYMQNYVNANPPYDYEPDQYYYSLPNGKSGKFVLKRDGTAILQKPEKIQIIPDLSHQTFQIIDIDGYVYDFNLVQTCKGSQETQTHLSAWYITKITSPAGNYVTFTYQTVGSNDITPVGSWSEIRDDYEFPQIYPLVVPGDGQVTSQKDPPQQGWNNPTNYSTVILDKIDFTNGVVQFNYSNDRQDLSNDRKLTNVAIYTKDDQGNIGSSPLKKFIFSYDYFSGVADNSANLFQAPTAVQSLRLKLTQIQETGYFNGQTISKPPYVFSYYETGTDVLPAKTSFARDHWGYYNGQTGRQSLIPTHIAVNSSDQITYAIGLDGNEREPNPVYTPAFSLQSIKYPTGGSTEFQYETNTYDEQKSDVNDHSLFVSQASIVQQTGTNTYDYADGNHWVTPNTVDLSNEYGYGANQSPQFVHLSVTYRFPNSNCNQTFADQITFEIKNHLGTTVMSKNIKDFYTCTNGNTNSCMLCGSGGVYVYNTDTYLPPDVYTITMSVGNGYSGALQNIFFTFTWYTEANTNQSGLTYSYGGGLRIKKIIDHDAINPADDKVTKYIYHYFSDPNQTGNLLEYSNGRRMSKPHYAYFKRADENVLYYSLSGGSYYTYQNVYHLMRSADSWNPLNGSAGGSVVGYDTVTVLYGENGENGKTVYNYHNQPDIVNVYNQYSYEFRPPYSSNIQDPLNGSLLLQSDYKNVNGQFKKIKEISNNYTTGFPDESLASNGNIAYGIQSIPITVCNITFPNSTGSIVTYPTLRFEIAYRTITSDWNYLTSSDAKMYDQNDDTKYAETLTNYYYDNPKHLLPTRTVVKNSKGENVTTTTSYPLDFTTTGTSAIGAGIQNLLNKNVVNAPIETYVQKTNADGSNKRTISSVLTAYNTTDLTLTSLYQSQTAQPLSTFSPLTLTSSSANIDASYKTDPIISFDFYDSHGNILQQHKLNDINHSYIWDYHSSLPIADVVDSKKADIAYTSFEADGSGNWTFTGTPVSSTNIIPVTGSRYYNLNATNSLSKTVTSSNSYIVSYWTKNTAALSVTGSVSTVTGTRINGWTYFEHTVSGVSTVTISGSGKIDEVRLYPAGAQMSTYTYSPLIGMTSQCDQNNTVTYYEYDGLGRLLLIRDAHRNIIKMYGYNYAGQKFNPNRFYNKTQTNAFVKNDCTDTAMVGTEQLDSVAAGTFFSDISQPNADSMAVSQLDSIGQPDANLNGACVLPVVLTLVNYDHITGFSLTLTDVYDSTRTITVPFPIDSATTTQKITPARYNITISKPGNTDSHVFTASGPGGSIQVNSVTASWSNVYVNTDVFDKLTIGISH